MMNFWAVRASLPVLCNTASVSCEPSPAETPAAPGETPDVTPAPAAALPFPSDAARSAPLSGSRLSEDQRLVERCRAHDPQAFQMVMEQHKARVFGYLLRMTGSRDDAEDLTQETLVRMYASLHTFRREASLHTWLLRIAANLCVDFFRRNRRRRESAAFSLDEPGPDGESTARDVADEAWEPLRVLQKRERAGQLEAALMRLPDKLRAVMVLHDIEDVPYEEIARILGCPLGTVKSRLFNARAQMRRLLSEYLTQ